MYDFKNNSLIAGTKYSTSTLFSIFGVPNSTNSKKSFFSELERFYEFEKSRTSVVILNKREEVKPKKEHKNKKSLINNQNKKGKFSLNDGTVNFLYVNLIMSVIINDSEEEENKIIGKSMTFSQLQKNFFDIDRSKRNYIELYKSQYFRGAFNWLYNTGNIGVAKSYIGIKATSHINQSTGEIVFDTVSDKEYIKLENEEIYEKFLEIRKDIFTNYNDGYFKNKYKNTMNFELYADDIDRDILFSLTNGRMFDITSGKFGLRDFEFLFSVIESIEISLPTILDSEFKTVYTNNYFSAINKMIFIMLKKRDLCMYSERYIDSSLFFGSLSKEEVKEKCGAISDYVSLNDEVFTTYSSEEREEIEKNILPFKLSY